MSLACHQFFPTRMLGLRRGSRFGSELAEALPSLAMMIIKVKNPNTPTRRSMKIRCFRENDVRFPPVRFLQGKRKVKEQFKSIQSFLRFCLPMEMKTSDSDTNLRIRANQLNAGLRLYLSSSKSIGVTKLWLSSRVS